MTGGDTHAAADIICYMNGYKDNRREKFFTKSEWAGQDYVGMRRGIVIPELKTTGHLSLIHIYYFRWLYTAFTRATKTLYLVNYPKEQIL